MGRIARWAPGEGGTQGSDYPQADKFASGYVLEPPSEAEMIEIFDTRSLSA